MTTIEWHSVDKPFKELKAFDEEKEPDKKHTISIQREAIPIIIVPGIMGTALKRGKKIVWNPRRKLWMLSKYLTASAKKRRRLLIGKDNEDYFKDYLKVDNDSTGDGRHSIIDRYWIHALPDSYHKIFKKLKKEEWEGLNKVFEFPVYAFGYNWTNSNDTSGEKLADRIKKIKEEAKKITGECKKVIIITHSMGGLVARSASVLHKAEKDILGIIHGTQPVTGAPLIYAKAKIGNLSLISGTVLGASAKENVPIIGNTPGGLELLPSASYVDNDGKKSWLTITDKNGKTTEYPKETNKGPFEEIYKIKGTADESLHKDQDRKLYGFIDPDLLNPKLYRSAATDKDKKKVADDEWKKYIDKLKAAEEFQKKLGNKAHPNTYNFYGDGHACFDRIELYCKKRESSIDTHGNVYKETLTPYKRAHFRGRNKDCPDDHFVDLRLPKIDGKKYQGDDTAPLSSATTLTINNVELKNSELDHMKAFNNSKAQLYCISSIYTMCEEYIYSSCKVYKKIYDNDKKANSEGKKQ